MVAHILQPNGRKKKSAQKAVWCNIRQLAHGRYSPCIPYFLGIVIDIGKQSYIDFINLKKNFYPHWLVVFGKLKKTLLNSYKYTFNVSFNGLKLQNLGLARVSYLAFVYTQYFLLGKYPIKANNVA